MTTRAEKRRAAAGKAGSANGTGQVDMLAPEQVEELRVLLQPLVMQWRFSQAAVMGYLTALHMQNVSYTIDVLTGLVTLTAPPVPGPVAAPPAEGSPPS